MIGQADAWIGRTTTGCVALLALIAGTVSYLHMHRLVALHGQPGWVAALTPLSVDGMIVAASTTLLAESRAGRRGGALPWALLVVGSMRRSGTFDDSLLWRADPVLHARVSERCRLSPVHLSGIVQGRPPRPSVPGWPQSRRQVRLCAGLQAAASALCAVVAHGV